MGQELLENWICQKSNFGKVFFSALEKIHFCNACVVQTNLGTNELLNKNCAKEYGLQAKRI